MDVDSAIITLFPRTAEHWQKLMYQLILGAVVLTVVLTYVDHTNPVFDSLKALSTGVLPFLYIAWMLTMPVHAHKIALKTAVFSFIVNLLSTSVNVSSSPAWVQDGVNAAQSLSLGLLQGSIFATVYTFRG